MRAIENPNCTACQLHQECRNVCLPSLGAVNCKLAIFLPQPDMIEDRRGKGMVGQRFEFVCWLLRKMGIGIEQVYFDYIIKCHGKLPGKKEDRMAVVRACRQYLIASLQRLTKLRAVVGLGSIASEVLVGKTKVGEAEGTNWSSYEPALKNRLDHVWISYDPLYADESPVESGAIYRTIYVAAQECGLSPHPVMGVSSFNFNK